MIDQEVNFLRLNFHSSCCTSMLNWRIIKKPDSFGPAKQDPQEAIVLAKLQVLLLIGDENKEKGRKKKTLGFSVKGAAEWTNLMAAAKAAAKDPTPELDARFTTALKAFMDKGMLSTERGTALQPVWETHQELLKKSTAEVLTALPVINEGGELGKGGVGLGSHGGGGVGLGSHGGGGAGFDLSGGEVFVGIPVGGPAGQVVPSAPPAPLDAGGEPWLSRAPPATGKKVPPGADDPAANKASGH
jgi:hypothetical protein